MKPLLPEHEILLQEYQQYLGNTKEQSTLKMYLTEIRHFLNWLELKEKQVATLNQGDIIAFRDEMVGRGRKISTINKGISILSSFLKWVKDKGLLIANVAEHLRFLEPKTDKPHWLTSQEVEQLLNVAACERNPFKKARNEALIHIMLNAGLRIEEISELKYESIDQGELVIREDGNEKRRVPIIPELQVKLLEWLKFRSQSPKKAHQESHFLFVTERSGYMQTRSIQFVIEGYSEKMGFHVTCQMLRNTFCRRLVEQGMPVRQIKQWAGHKALQSTVRYLDE